MMITSQQLRQLYGPVGPSHRPNMDCCVGGALVLYMGGYMTFPYADRLATALKKANPTLSWEQSMVRASNIIEYNDVQENIEAAWAELDFALTSQGEMTNDPHENNPQGLKQNMPHMAENLEAEGL